MDFVCNQAAIAVNQALDNLQTAQLKIATGEAKGKIAYNYYAPELYDPRMSVIQAITPAGKTIGTLVNYADPSRSSRQRRRAGQPRPRRPAVRQARSRPRRHGHVHERRQGGMITADNRLLDKPSDPLKRQMARRAHLGRMPAHRPAHGLRSRADRQGRRAADRPRPWPVMLGR